MPVQTTEQFFEDLERSSYRDAWPWERYFINQLRRRDGERPFTRADLR